MMRGWCVLLLTLSLVGCAGSPPDIPISPTVSSTSPADKATNVARETSITATFSQPMSASSLAGSAFTLAPAVAGSVTVSGATATFAPSAPLAFATTYTATITTAATSVAGGALAQSFSWSFTTIPVTPVVISTNPARSATGVAANTTVSATFSQAMLPASINAASFTLSPAVAGSVTFSGTTATFAPSAQLAYATIYLATITTEAKDTSGTALSTPYNWSFTTVAQPGAAVAVAGPNQDVNRSNPVTLDGSASHGAPGLTLTYSWTQVGGSLRLTGASPSFTAPATVGTVLFDLVVSDTLTTSLPSRVQINVMEDKAKAVFVSKTGADSGSGTRLAPMLTIQAAINRATSNGAGVYVGAGDYAESLTLASGVSIYGGFDASWVRDTAASITKVIGGTQAISGNAVSLLTIDGLTVTSRTATAPGASSYGLFFANSSGVTVSNNRITAGSGAAGADGVPGSLGLPGASGASGGNGCINGAICGATGGFGGGPAFTLGTGGSGGAGHIGASGDPGLNGLAGSSGSGGLGGRGGVYNAANAVAESGANGGTPPSLGATGANGIRGGDFGGGHTVNGYLASFGTAGAPGGVGNGGGGGGAGAGSCSGPFCTSFSTGNGGGGGGQGGAGGGGGSGGQGGGGSFGIYSFGSQLTSTANAVVVGSGGLGGLAAAGASGGPGGSGGLGGAVSVGKIGAGGAGGAGSAGGSGGAGGAGGLGPAAAIFP